MTTDETLAKLAEVTVAQWDAIDKRNAAGEAYLEVAKDIPEFQALKAADDEAKAFAEQIDDLSDQVSDEALKDPTTQDKMLALIVAEADGNHPEQVEIAKQRSEEYKAFIASFEALEEQMDRLGVGLEDAIEGEATSLN